MFGTMAHSIDSIRSLYVAFHMMPMKSCVTAMSVVRQGLSAKGAPDRCSIVH